MGEDKPTSKRAIELQRAVADDELQVSKNVLSDQMMTRDRLQRKQPDIVQEAFDVFCELDRDKDRRVTEEDLRRLLRVFSNLIGVKESDAHAIMEVCEGKDAQYINFSDFHNIYSALIICSHLQRTDVSRLRVDDVRECLIKAGITPTKQQVEGMFLLGEHSGTFDPQQHRSVPFLDFFRIFLHTRTSSDAHDLFLHSWFLAGRNSTPFNKSLEISPIQDFVAGTLAGVALTLVGHPFDTIKVRLQTQRELYKTGWDCLKKTVTKEGFLAVYKGMGGPMLTIPLVNAVVFAAYAQAKDLMHQFQKEPKPLSLTQISIAGAYAGLINCAIVSPVELIKTRLQIQHEQTSLRRTLRSRYAAKPTEQVVFNGPVDCVRKIYQKNGLKGLYRGMTSTIYREIPGYGGQFWMYEALKRGLTREGEAVHDLGAVPLIIAGGTAGIFGWCCSYPFDYIKSQIQAEPYDKRTTWRKHPLLLDGGFWDCARQTVARGGFKALWKGFGPCAARAFPANAAGFLAYEFGLNMLRSWDS